MLTGKDLGAAMRAAQAQSGLTVRDIAKQCEVTPSAVYAWFKTGRISKPLLVRLSELTGVSFRGWLEETASPRAPFERMLLDVVREMTTAQQHALLSVALTMVGAPEHLRNASPAELQMAFQMDRIEGAEGKRNAEVHQREVLQRRSMRAAADGKGHRAPAAHGTGNPGGRQGQGRRKED